jgi:hypothetical protein
LLTQNEVKQLERLEDEQARGVAVIWDEPKTIRGIVIRDVETIAFTDTNDNQEKTKRLVTLRTTSGLETVFDGPLKLNGRLFEGERYKQEPLGPPCRGDFLVIIYKGEKVAQSGRTFKDFDVLRSRPEVREASDQPALGDVVEAERGSSQLGPGGKLPF